MMALWIGLVSAVLSCLLTPLVARLAHAWGVIDQPKGGRKVHKRATPLMGGLAIYVALTLVVVLVLMRSTLLTSGAIDASHYVGILLGGAVLMIGGWLDDRYQLRPGWQLVAPVLASLIVILAGLDIQKLTNPFGGFFLLTGATWQLGQIGTHALAMSWPWDVLVFVWLMGMMYTMKVLDGLDGLATSIGSVGALMVLLLAASTAFFQPDVVVFAAMVLGALLGFLFWNRAPAQIFLGEGGALFVGFLLGVLAVISGGKIATLLLVTGVPILDVIWVVVRRWRSGAPITKGDRLHLHHRLYDRGLTHGQVVLLYTVVSLLFGGLTLILSSWAKLVALGVLALGMATLAMTVLHSYSSTHTDV